MTAISKNKNSIIIAIVVVVLVAIIVAAALLNRSHSWVETYEPDDNNPYGTQVLYDLLKASRKEQSFTKINDSTFKDLPIDPTSEEDTYIFIGANFYANSTDVERLLEFVKAGNSAFLIVENQNHLITDSLIRLKLSPVSLPIEGSFPHSDGSDVLLEEDETYHEDDDYYNENDNDYYPDEYSEEFSTQSEPAIKSLMDTTVSIQLKGFNGEKPYYHIYKKYRDRILQSYWPYFNPDMQTYHGDSITLHGNIASEYPNYISFPYGRGRIYMHTTPIIFSNYYMIKDSTMNYCRDALSYIGDGNVYWDEENRSYDHNAPTPRNENQEISKPSEGPLEFVLSEPSLRTAWYILLVATLLYLMFGAKRKQRIVQPMENMENTSIEYAEVISQMFMRQRDHKKLVLMKMDLFKSFLRERFKLKLPSTFQDENDAFYAEISLKSNIHSEHIKSIFEDYKYLSSITSVETPEMFRFHQKIEHFYNNCK